MDRELKHLPISSTYTGASDDFLLTCKMDEGRRMSFDTQIHANECFLSRISVQRRNYCQCHLKQSVLLLLPTPHCFSSFTFYWVESIALSFRPRRVLMELHSLSIGALMKV